MVLNATGVWTEVNYGDAPKYSTPKPNEIFINKKDREILKKLASIVLEISLRKTEKEKKDLWYAHNSLKNVRPLILTDVENGWNEIITEKDLECSGSLARRWEVVLKKEIFWGNSIKDDRPAESIFELGYSFKESTLGVIEHYHGGKKGGSYTWTSPIKNIDDLKNLHFSNIKIDYKTTLNAFSLASDIFKDILSVRIRNPWWWSWGLTYDAVKLVGLQNLLMYFYDNPQLIHKVMEFLKDNGLNKLDFLEKNNLLSLNNNSSYVGSGGIGYSDELPKNNIFETGIKTTDMWGFCESQETGQVSPQMFEEFVFQYQLPFLKRFGLNCYGCCEPIDKRWHIVKKAPNLRRVSVSAWADPAKMAEFLTNKYIYSYKPNPADLAVNEINSDLIRKKIRNILEITKGCILEIIMKDNHTLGKNPNNIINWTKIVREEINNFHN
ncbi:MAG TPA: hypothetical protein VIK09_01825 [Candidatus Humimicrobiaceae bacterium]